VQHRLELVELAPVDRHSVVDHGAQHRLPSGAAQHRGLSLGHPKPSLRAISRTPASSAPTARSAVPLKIRSST